MSQETYELFKNLLYMLGEITSYDCFSSPPNSLLDNCVNEITLILYDYEQNKITEQAVIDRLEIIIKSIIDSNECDDNRYINYFKSFIEPSIPMFKCFLTSSNLNKI